MKDKRIGRRDFMKTTLAGCGGLFLLASEAKGQETKVVDSKGKERKVHYRTLGHTGLNLPVINMGVMNSDNPNLIRAALDSGIVLLDTAHGYMGGRNEETIGSVIKGRPRDSFMIGSKVSLPQDRSTGLYLEGATTDEFLRKLDISLKRLGVDHVEILYHHGVSRKESVVYEPVLKAMEKAKKEGKIRFAGISTHMNEPEVVHATVDSKFYDVILVAYNFQQKHYTEVRSAIARAAQAGIGIVGMKAIRGGFRQTPSVQSAAAALKWVLQDPNVHTIVPGFTAFEEMETDLAVLENPGLTEDEKKTLRKEASLTSLYCQGCRQCLKQCREQLPVPDLMRAYMYTYAYRNLALAQDLLLSLKLPSRACEDCSQCSVKCSVGFNVPAKIKDVVRLKDVPPEFIG
jgi:predicted aldo/keto reductase-like oxidoreductase